MLIATPKLIDQAIDRTAMELEQPLHTFGITNVGKLPGAMGGWTNAALRGEARTRLETLRRLRNNA